MFCFFAIQSSNATWLLLNHMAFEKKYFLQWHTRVKIIPICFQNKNVFNYRRKLNSTATCWFALFVSVGAANARTIKLLFLRKNFKNKNRRTQIYNWHWTAVLSAFIYNKNLSNLLIVSGFCLSWCNLPSINLTFGPGFA